MYKKVEVSKEKLMNIARSVMAQQSAIESIAESLSALVVRKNADYGDAWQKFGPFTSLIRLNDKLCRVETLSDGRKAMIADEQIQDTLRDIVAYGLLCLLWFEYNGTTEVKEMIQLALPFQQIIDALAGGDEPDYKVIDKQLDALDVDELRSVMASVEARIHRYYKSHEIPSK